VLKTAWFGLALWELRAHRQPSERQPAQQFAHRALVQLDSKLLRKQPPHHGSDRQFTGGRRGPLGIKRTLRLEGGCLHAADSLRPDQASANECVRAYALKTDTGRPPWGIRQKPLQLRRCG
jgi:hypothetical protein